MYWHDFCGKTANGIGLKLENGLRQGCIMAPTLLNLYFNAIVFVWREQCGEIGVPVLYKHGRKLVGDCTVKSRLLRVRISESQFADDLALYAVNCAMFELVEVCSGGRSFWFDYQYPEN